MIKILKQLNQVITSRIRNLIIVFVCFSLFSAILEVLQIFFVSFSIASLIDSSGSSQQTKIINSLPIFIQNIVTFAVSSQSRIFALVITVIVLCGISRVLSNLLYNKLTQEFSCALFTRSYDAIFKLSIQDIQCLKQGVVLSVLINDIEKSVLFFNSLLQVILSTLISIGLIYTMITGIGNIGIVIFFAISTLYVIIIILTKELTRSSSLSLKKNIDLLNNNIVTSYQCSKDIRIYGMFDDLRTQAIDANNNYRSSILKINFLGVSTKTIVELFGFASLIILSLLNYISLYQLSVAILVFQRLLPSAQQLFSNFNALKLYKYSLKNVCKTIVQYEAKCLNSVAKINTNRLIKILGKSDRSTLIIKRFEYKNENSFKLVLDKIVNFKTGDVVALKGGSGEGKSTFLDIILGFRSNNSINNTPKYNSPTDLSVSDMWASSLYLSQNSPVIGDTVRKILDNYLHIEGFELKESNILTALKKSLIYDDIMNLENGIDHFIGENACLLSGGQRQRIRLSLMFLTKKPIFLIDEATNAIDERSERKIFNQLIPVLENKITFIISHGSEYAKFCNQSLCIENGMIHHLK